jgi:hypothetical protein
MSAVLIRRGMQGRTGRKKEKNPTAVFECIGSNKNPNNINPNSFFFYHFLFICFAYFSIIKMNHLFYRRDCITLEFSYKEIFSADDSSLEVSRY